MCMKHGIHLVVENLRFASLSGWNEVLVKNAQNVVADVGELGLDLGAVRLDLGDLGIVALGLLLLLN